MKKNFSFCSVIMAFFTIAIFTTFGSCKTRGGENAKSDTDSINVSEPLTYNIYVENSGSMAGYCNYRDQKAMETLLDDYYDRLSSSLSDGDSITLNFINTNIEHSNISKTDYLKSIKGKCTAQYTKLDDMLTMMMDNVTDKDVNILVSDYVFTTDNGNFSTASSAITALFAKQLRNKDLAIAIFKYMRNFNGKYYPGGLSCHKPLPLYIWVFGKRENVNKVAKLPFNTINCGTYFLQKNTPVEFNLLARNHRMIKKQHTINVSEWDASRHGDYYEFELEANLSGLLLGNDDLLNKTNYIIKSTGSTQYYVESVNDEGDNKYKFTIRTVGNGHPAPGSLSLVYPVVSPEWVESSNFEGSGIPADSTTYGVSYLISGVSKAYNDIAKNKFNYFEININLE